MAEEAPHRLVPMFYRLGAAALTAAALLTMSACSSGEPTPSNTVPPASAPVGGEATGQTFEGDPSTETIMVGPQEVLVPEGIKLPETSVVSSGEEYAVMLIDEDPAAVIEAVTTSAAASGYEVYATPDDATTVWVGNGNAVSLLAIPGAQMLTWGPDSMKDVLANPQG